MQTTQRLTMIGLQDRREHHSMQEKTYLYGIHKDVFGYQQRSYAALPTVLTWSWHLLAPSMYVLETTSKPTILQLTRHLKSPRSWNHQPQQLCHTQPQLHHLLHPQHLQLQTSCLCHRWSYHLLLQQHQLSSLQLHSLLSSHQQHQHPHLCSDNPREPLYHQDTWSQRSSLPTVAATDPACTPTMISHCFLKTTMTMCHASP